MKLKNWSVKLIITHIKVLKKTFMPKMNSKLLVKVSNLIIVKTMEFVVNTSIMTGMALVGVQ